MTRRSVVGGLAVAVTAGALVWVFLVWLPGRYAGSGPSPPPPVRPFSEPQPKIKATLYFVSESGSSLVPVEQDVPFGEGIVEQARRILEAQFGEAPAPFTSAIPAGTTLRALFIDRGRAYVDLGPEAVASHPGGSLNELLTVFTIVDALTTNLPAITSVQILVGGHEVDSLAGHVDLRRPIRRGAAIWSRPSTEGAPVERLPDSGTTKRPVGLGSPGSGWTPRTAARCHPAWRPTAV
jgi:hypothetical protein